MSTERRLAIVTEFATGILLSRIFTHYGTLWRMPEHAGIIGDFVSLHNEGSIDVLQVILEGDLTAVDNSEFFAGQDFFVHIIPDLHASPRDMRCAVRLLVCRAGHDGAAYWPYRAIATWCASKSERIDELIQLEVEEVAASPVLMFALVAGAKLNPDHYQSVMKVFLAAESQSYQQQGARALSETVWPTRNHHEAAVSALVTHIQRTDSDLIVATCFSGLVDLRDRPFSISDALFDTVTDAVGRSPGEHTRRSIAWALGSSSVNLSNRSVEVLLQCLKQLDFGNKDILGNIDRGLSNLLKRGDKRTVLNFTKELLLERSHDLCLSDFPSFCGELRNLQPEELGALAVELFLTGEPRLCRAVDTIISHGHLVDQSLAFDFAPSSLEPQCIPYLMRKAIGYLFLHPVSAASLIFCLTRASRDHESLAKDLVFSDLLCQYGGHLRRYLEDQASTRSSLEELARWAISRQDEYFSGLRRPGELAELHPSERQRRVQSRLEYDQAASTVKSAQEQSTLFSLLRKQLLLYGSRSIAQVEVGDGVYRRTDMSLGKIETSVEIPRGLILSPMLLEYRLFEYRREKIPT